MQKSKKKTKSVFCAIQLTKNRVINFNNTVPQTHSTYAKQKSESINFQTASKNYIFNLLTAYVRSVELIIIERHKVTYYSMFFRYILSNCQLFSRERFNEMAFLLFGCVWIIMLSLNLNHLFIVMLTFALNCLNDSTRNRKTFVSPFQIFFLLLFLGFCTPTALFFGIPILIE